VTEQQPVPTMTMVTELQPVPAVTKQQSVPTMTMVTEQQPVPTVTKQQPVPAVTMVTEQQPVSASTTVTKQQFQSASKRKSFFSSPKTSVNRKQAKVSNAHLQISSVAQSRCSQIDEHLFLMKVREDREKDLHKLNIEYLKEKQQREVEAHKIDMKIKEMQLQLLEKQLQ